MPPDSIKVPFPQLFPIYIDWGEFLRNTHRNFIRTIGSKTLRTLCRPGKTNWHKLPLSRFYAYTERPSASASFCRENPSEFHETTPVFGQINLNGRIGCCDLERSRQTCEMWNIVSLPARPASVLRVELGAVLGGKLWFWLWRSFFENVWSFQFDWKRRSQNETLVSFWRRNVL